MKYLQRVTTILFALIIMVAVQAQEPAIAKEFENRLSAASSQNRTITSRFTMVRGVAGIKKQVESCGGFYYDNSGNMAMIYDTPKGDKVVMNGDDFTIVVGGKTISSNSSSNPMMAQISYMMQASMSGDVAKLGRGWDLKIDKTEDQYRVSVMPTERRVKRYISVMTMLFDQSTMTLNSLRIDESRGGFTSYHFTSKKLNEAIDPIFFRP